MNKISGYRHVRPTAFRRRQVATRQLSYKLAEPPSHPIYYPFTQNKSSLQPLDLLFLFLFSTNILCESPVPLSS